MSSFVNWTGILELKIFNEKVINICNNLLENNMVRKLGIVNHDIFQEKLVQLGEKYNLEVRAEYCGVSFYDDELRKNKRGRIDLAYFKNGISLIALEIDSGLKSHL